MLPLRQNRSRAAVFRRTQLGVPIRAAENDVGHVGQCLGIINDRGTAPKSNHRREGRPNARNASLAFERFHQRRLFADFVSSRAAVPVDVEVAPAAENVLANKPLGIGIADRLLHDLRRYRYSPRM